MASHGATKSMAVSEPGAKTTKAPPSLEFSKMHLSKGVNGVLTVEHHYEDAGQKPQTFTFRKDQGEELRAHLEKHLEIDLPGKSKTETMESKEQDE